jgi:hypothetical protein
MADEPVYSPPPPEMETRFYVYTYVTGWGEESAPSPPSEKIVCPVDAEITLTGFSVGPSGPYNMGAGVGKKRIYRLSTGTDASQFFFVGEIDIAVTTFVDNVPSSDLQEALETEGWLPPPEDLQGLTALANGVLCGFVGKDVYFTPPYVPYAWPREYMVSSEYEVVGIGAYGTNAVVLTKGYPYLASGVDPSAMTLSKMEIPQACVSKRSIASFGTEGVVYATPDGLAVIGPSGFDMLSHSFMTQEEWRLYNPSSIVGAAHDGRYIAFFTRLDGTKGGFIFDKDNGFRRLSFHTDALHQDLETDTLYYVMGAQVLAYDSGGALFEYRWKSKIFEFRPTCFTMGRVIGDYSSGYLRLRIYTDGELWHEQLVIPGPDHFRLPSNDLMREWQIELEGTASVQEITLATSSSEFRDDAK